MSPLIKRVEPHEMGTAPVTSILLRMALPMILAGLLSTAYQLVDMLFVNWLGPDQRTGFGASLPVVFFIFAIGQAAAIGGGILISRRLGEQRMGDARQTLEQALIAAFIVGGTLSLFGPAAITHVLTAMGAEGTVHQMAILYLHRLMFGTLFFHLMITADSCLRAQGNTMTGMKVGLLVNIINLILDGFFIFGPNNLPTQMPQVWPLENLGELYVRYGFDFGIQGGATTTVLAQMIGATLLIGALLNRRTVVRPFIQFKRGLKLRGGTLINIYLLGLPATVSIIGMSISGFLINSILLGIDDLAVGIMATANRIEMVVFVPIFCIGASTIPLCGYNLGAKKIVRCRQIVVRGAILASVFMGTAGLVLFAFPRFFLSIFSTEPQFLDMGSEFLRINSLIYFVIGVDIVLSNAFQGLGRPALSTLVQLIRTLFVKVPAAWLLAGFFGVTGVWWSFPISSVACCITAILLMWYVLRQLSKQYADDDETDSEIPPQTPAPADAVWPPAIEPVAERTVETDENVIL